MKTGPGITKKHYWGKPQAVAFFTKKHLGRNDESAVSSQCWVNRPSRYINMYYSCGINEGVGL